jgi:hypothetical protein
MLTGSGVTDNDLSIESSVFCDVTPCIDIEIVMLLSEICSSHGRA